jgi:hypothetical protein
MLLYNGFVEGVDFIFKSEWNEQQISFNVGYSYNNTDVLITELINVYEGSCNLRYKSYSSYVKIIKFVTSGFDISGGAINCYGLTNSQRYIKPSTLLQRIKEKNSQSEREYEKDNKDQIILDYTVEKYKKLYPEAEIKADKDYTEYRGRVRSTYETFNTVKVNFKSGSYVILRLGWENDKEFLFKKFNNATELKLNELMEMFNNQPKKI